MTRTRPTWRQQNLNGSFVAVMAFGLLTLTSGQNATWPYVPLTLAGVWMLYEWAQWYRSRAMNPERKVVLLRQVFRTSLVNWPNSYVFSGATILLPCFVLMGWLTTELYGALVGFACGVLCVLHAIAIDMYPPG